MYFLKWKFYHDWGSWKTQCILCCVQKTVIETVWQFLKWWNRATVSPRNPTPKYIFMRYENIYPCKNLHTNVHSSIICYSQKKWQYTKYSPTNEWMTYPYSEMLFSNRKKWNADRCYHMDETWKHALKRIESEKIT